MASYNKVILMGNLTRDPQLTYTSSNMPICKFGLAVNRRFKDSQSGEWKEEPTFIDVTIFGARAEPFARYHTKGKPAFVEGSLRLDTWEDKNGGGKRSKVEIVANTVQFLGSREDGGNSGGGARQQQAQSDPFAGGDDIPGDNSGFDAGTPAAVGGGGGQDDDIPF